MIIMKNKKILIILCSLLLLFLLGWYCTRFLPDPRIVEILEMQQKIQNNIKNNGPANLEEAKEIAASAAQIREKINSLPDNLRQKMRGSGGRNFQNNMNYKINAYFSLPPSKRKMELDRQIKQDEMMRQAYSLLSNNGNNGNNQNRNQTGQNNQNNQNNQNRNQTGQNNGAKSRIDRTSPEQRAQYTEYRRAMDVRRKELGL